MQSNATAKTRLGPKAWQALALLGLASAIFFVVAWALPQSNDGRRSVKIGSQTYRLEVASTSEQHAKGLGGRTALDRHSGMLFVYERAERVCMWMKDMHLPLDILWLDNGKRVLHIERDVAPETYPDTFCPNTAARYVIELPSGSAKAEQLEIGDVINF